MLARQTRKTNENKPKKQQKGNLSVEIYRELKTTVTTTTTIKAQGTEHLCFHIHIFIYVI